MARSLPIGALAVLALSTGACSSLQYGADFDRSAGFDELVTYGVMLPNEEESQALAQVSPFLERRLERALRDQMEARGYVENTEGTPDFWVSAYPVLLATPASSEGAQGAVAVPTAGGTNVAVSFGFAVGPPWGYPGAFGYPYHRVGPWWGFPGYGFGFGCCAYPAGFAFGVQSFGGYGPHGPGVGMQRPGTLVVEVLDGESQNVVWQGWAENALQEAPDPRYMAEYVDEIVERVLREFPPAVL